MRFDQYAGHCIVSNFRLHRDSHSQILTAKETPSALTLARSNLIRLSSLDLSYLLHQHCCVMTSLTCCISIVASPPCGSSSFPAYRGSALVKTMPSVLLPLVFICFPNPWHLLLLKLRFSTKLHLHCLHLTRLFLCICVHVRLCARACGCTYALV